MKREFNVEAMGRPKWLYKETITMEAEAECKYVKQSGGKGNMATALASETSDKTLKPEDALKMSPVKLIFEFINSSSRVG